MRVDSSIPGADFNPIAAPDPWESLNGTWNLICLNPMVAVLWKEVRFVLRFLRFEPHHTRGLATIVTQFQWLPEAVSTKNMRRQLRADPNTREQPVRFLRVRLESGNGGPIRELLD